MTTCRCGTPTRDNTTTCDTCLDTLTTALRETPWLNEQLDITITRQRATPTEGGSRAAHTPLPWHEAAANAKRNLHQTLTNWVRRCHTDRVRSSDPTPGLPQGEPPTLIALSKWLLWRVDGLAYHTKAAEAVDEITSATASARSIIDRRPDRWYAGPCLATDEDDIECQRELYARRRTGTITCPDCLTTHEVDERREWLLKQAEDVLTTAAELARAVSWLGAEPLTADRVRKWAQRDRITTRGHDRTGRPLYRVGDAIDLLAGDTRRGNPGASTPPPDVSQLEASKAVMPESDPAA